MEGHCSTGQSPQWAVVPIEEEEEEEEEEDIFNKNNIIVPHSYFSYELSQHNLMIVITVYNT